LEFEEDEVSPDLADLLELGLGGDHLLLDGLMDSQEPVVRVVMGERGDWATFCSSTKSFFLSRLMSSPSFQNAAMTSLEVRTTPSSLSWIWPALCCSKRRREKKKKLTHDAT